MARTMETYGKVLIVVVVAAVLAVSACSGSDDETASHTAADTASDAGRDTATGGGAAPADGEGEGDGGDDAAGGGAVTDVGGVDLVAADVDRKITYRGDIAAEVDDVAAAARSARDEVAAEGGYVFGQEITAGSARVVLKVPSVRFDAAFEAVAGIGEVTSQTIEADDVSEQFTDLESRRATLEASIARLRGFLASTSNVDEISRLESELTHREAERDVIAGQLRVLEDRTSFGTISVTYTASEDAEVAPADDGDAGPPGFGRGLEIGWDGVVFAAGVAATVGGFALPFLPMVAVALAVGWWWRRRRPGGINPLAERPS